MRHSTPELSPKQGDDLLSSELLIRSFGPDESLAHRLIEQVATWDAAGRPLTGALRIRAYPPDTGEAPMAGEIVLQKEWTRLVLDWR